MSPPINGNRGDGTIAWCSTSAGTTERLASCGSRSHDDRWDTGGYLTWGWNRWKWSHCGGEVMLMRGRGLTDHRRPYGTDKMVRGYSISVFIDSKTRGWGIPVCPTLFHLQVNNRLALVACEFPISVGWIDFGFRCEMCAIRA